MDEKSGETRQKTTNKKSRRRIQRTGSGNLPGNRNIVHRESMETAQKRSSGTADFLWMRMRRCGSAGCLCALACRKPGGRSSASGERKIPVPVPQVFRTDPGWMFSAFCLPVCGQVLFFSRAPECPAFLFASVPVTVSGSRSQGGVQAVNQKKGGNRSASRIQRGPHAAPDSPWTGRAGGPERSGEGVSREGKDPAPSVPDICVYSARGTAVPGKTEA